MAKTTSIKRARQARERTVRNRVVRSRVKTAVRRFLVALREDGENAGSALRDAVRQLDRAAAKGVIHPNAAARRKSRLMSRFAAARPVKPAEPEPGPEAPAEAPAKKRAPRKRPVTSS